MTGPKLNEKSFVAGERAGTKASALYIRCSASKARLVLNIIRDLPVKQADEVLQFTDKGIAVTIRKVLASAVANAQHNDAQDPEELFVKACFADEGPTLRRFAARARGRGTRIQKRTCHITIVVDRLGDDRIAVLQAKESSRTAAGRRRGATSTTAARRERVARSRERADALKSGGADEATESNEDVSHLTDAQVADSQPQWDGSALPNEDGSAPDGYDIKGNANSMKYHEPDSRYYNQTIAEVYFDTVEHAEAAGFEAPAGTDHSDESDDSADATDADAGDEGIDDTSDAGDSTEQEEK
jgi:large subunit ribosomal protein L22